jgi:hypothetical protein
MARGSAPGQVRASGLQAGQEEAERAGEALDTPLTPETDTERKRELDQLGFTKMKVQWNTEERRHLTRINALVEVRLDELFGDLYRVMHDLLLLVCEQDVDEQGVAQEDAQGHPVWKTTPSGAREEDWAKLTERQRVNFLFRIQTQLYGWQQDAAQLRSEALFAKAVWQERFSVGYNRAVVGTVDDRNNAAQVHAASEKYFALMVGQLSDRADRLVRSMERLADRLQATIPR